MKLHVISFGCQMNVADSEEMSRPLLDRGFQTTSELEEADAILINTCTVRQHAEDRALSQIGRLKTWKAERPDRILIIAGCAAERLKADLYRRFPYVDLVAGAKSIEQFPEILEEALKEKFNWQRDNDNSWPGAFETTANPQSSIPSPQSPVTSFVTIMRGCNYTCTYCIVPSVRGREIYRPPQTILQEVREKVAQGAKEVMLLGQTVNSYRNQAVDFADLLRLVNAVEGLERIRFMSPHPFYLNERMISAMAECEKVCSHLHLPVQSGSDGILKSMRRNYTRSMFLSRISALRAAVPGIALTTDIIVGFPQETEEDFRQTLSLFEEADFDSAFCFKFSPREGTEAAQMPGEPSNEVKEERLQRLLELVQRRAARKAQEAVGRSLQVLLEDSRFGRSRENYKVRLSKPGATGEILKVRVTDSKNALLTAEAAE